MKNMKKDDIIQIIGIVIVVAIAICMFGCKTPQPIVQTEVKEVVVEREVRDTIVTIEPDSASIKALLECDSAGNVLIRELEETQGKNIALELLLRGYKSKPNEPSKPSNPITELLVDCKQDSLERVIALQNEKIRELTNNKQTETIEVKYIPDVVKWFAGIGAFFVVFYLVKFGLWVYNKFTLKV
jgi:hypothetical protein